ncbi:hypothetical protein D3C77_730050 [compost metagenome]
MIGLILQEESIELVSFSQHAGSNLLPTHDMYRGNDLGFHGRQAWVDEVSERVKVFELLHSRAF